MEGCIFCGKQYLSEIYKHYYYCVNCNVAVRDELFIADAEHRKELCNEEWIRKHSVDRDINTKADNLVRQIREIMSKGKILDVGCGSGVLVDKLSKDGYQATGIDRSEQAISFAEKYMEGTFMLGDADLTGIQGKELYDVVVASHILEHLDNPQPFFEGVKGALRGGDGYIIVAVPNLEWYDPDSFLRSNPGSIFDEDHTVCYSPRGLLKMLNQYGFYDVSITTKTHNTMLLTILAVNIYQKLTARSRNNDSPATTGKTNRTTISLMFERITDNPLTRLAAKPFNKISERRFKGMELIAIGRNK